MRSSRKPDEDDAETGRQIALMRKAARLSQGELAEHLGISAQQLSKYERGKNKLSKVRHDRAVAYITLRGHDLAGFGENRQASYVTAPPSLRERLILEIEFAEAAVDRVFATARLLVAAPPKS